MGESETIAGMGTVEKKETVVTPMDALTEIVSNHPEINTFKYTSYEPTHSYEMGERLEDKTFTREIGDLPKIQKAIDRAKALKKAVELDAEVEIQVDVETDEGTETRTEKRYLLLLDIDKPPSVKNRPQLEEDVIKTLRSACHNGYLFRSDPEKGGYSYMDGNLYTRQEVVAAQGRILAAFLEKVDSEDQGLVRVRKIAQEIQELQEQDLPEDELPKRLTDYGNEIRGIVRPESERKDDPDNIWNTIPLDVRGMGNFMRKETYGGIRITASGRKGYESPPKLVARV